MTAKKFEFTHSLKFNEQEYVEAHAELLRINRPFRLIAGSLIGVAMLFWQYTLVISICYFSFLLLVFFIIPRTMPSTLRSVFKSNRFIRQETIYSADQTGFTITTKGFKSRVSWNNAVFWQLTNNWLHIQTRGFPNAWFRVSDLKQAGVYECLVATLREHGVRRR